MNVQLHAPVRLLLMPVGNQVVPRTTRAVDAKRKLKFLSGQITGQAELSRPIAGFVKTKTNFDIWLAVHNSITFLLLPTWYTNFLFIHTNYIKLNSCTCFERNPLIIRRSTTQMVHMQPLVSSLSASDRLAQPLRKDFLSGCTRRSLVCRGI